MPNRFYELADYNGERNRGIAHIPETDAKMAALQADFNGWKRQCIEAEAVAEGMIVVELPDGNLLSCKPGRQPA